MLTYSDIWHNINIQLHVHLQRSMAQHNYPVTHMFTYSDVWHKINIQLHVCLQRCMAQHKYPVTCSSTVIYGTT